MDILADGSLDDAGLDRLYYVAEKPNGGSWNIYSMNPATGASEVLCNVIDSIFNAGVATDLSDMAIDRANGTLLLVSHEPKDGAVLAEALSLKAGRKVEIHRPQRGDKRGADGAACV